MQHSDIIEIRLYDSTFQIFFKGKARVNNKIEMKRLTDEIESKGITLRNSGWFD